MAFHRLLSRCRAWGLYHPVWYYTLPLALWSLFIAWGSLAPPDHLPPIEFRWSDKLAHAVLYAGLGALLLRGWVRAEQPQLSQAVWIWLMTSCWGVYLEFLQSLTPFRALDWTDAAANAIGTALGLALWIVFRRQAPPPDVQPPAQLGHASVQGVV